MKRGDAKKSSLTCNTFTPKLIELRKIWSRSPLCKGVLEDFVEVNPSTSVSHLNPETRVSFLPMENVAEKTGEIVLQEVPFEQVATGYTRFKEDDVLWAKITPCMQNGKCAVARNLIGGVGFGSTEYHVLRAKPDRILPEFLQMILTSEAFLEAAQGAFAGSAGQQRVPDTFLRNFPLPLPEFKEQQKIVAQLEAKRQERQRLLEQAEALLGEMDAYVLETLGLQSPCLTRRLAFGVRLGEARSRIDAHFHHPDFHALQSMLEGTPNVALGKVAEFSNEIWQSKLKQSATFRYIEISGVSALTGEVVDTETLVAEAPSRAKMQVRQGDILISTTRPHHGSIALLDERFEGCVASTGFSILRSVDEKRLSKIYLWCILRTQLCLKQMLRRSSGGNYPAITQSEIEKILIPLPSREVQTQIADEVKARREKARRLREEAEMNWQIAKADFELALLGGGK